MWDLQRDFVRFTAILMFVDPKTFDSGFESSARNPKPPGRPVRARNLSVTLCQGSFDELSLPACNGWPQAEAGL